MHAFELVEASAGSGKTTALVVRYLSLLFLGENPKQILALTFTNKAMSEMKERITQVLANLDQHSLYLGEISKATGLSQQNILANQKQVLNRFLNEANHIVTIDKFFNKVLRLFCFYDGISVDFSIKESMHRGELLHFFLSHLQTEPMNTLIALCGELNMNIESVVELFFVLLEIDYEELDFIKDEFIINNHINDEITTCLAKLDHIVQLNPASSASAKKAIKPHSKPEEILKTTWLQKETLSEYSYFKKIYTPEMDEIFAELKQLLLHYCKQKQTKTLAKLTQSFQNFKALKKQYQKMHNELCFIDVTNSIYRILKHNIDTDFLYFRLDGNISHILIDEFQDTSIVQYIIFKPIIEEILAGKGKKEKRTLFFVGDYKQSIYRFRGAKKELIEHLANDEQIHTSTLSTNYRSTKNIVNIVNQTFAPLYDNYTAQIASSEREGYVQIQSVEREDIRARLLNDISVLLQKGCDPSDITVLSFKNNDLLVINDWIKEEFKDIKTVTDINSKLINYPKVRAIIQLVNFLHLKDYLYLQNFIALTSHANEALLNKIGVQLLEKYEKTHNVFSLILNIIQEFELYDENTLLFLEHSQSYKDIVDFVYNVSMCEAKISSQELQGLRLTTIHKSKGLEFENVILLEPLSKSQPDRSTLLLEYENTSLEQIYLKIKNRECVDEEYQQALEKEKKARDTDLINSLYVAMTRAKENLFIIKSKEDSSLFTVLALEDTQVGILQTKPRKIQEVVPQILCDYTLKNYGLQDDFLHKEDEQEEQASLENIEYGNAMHYMLESLYAFDIDSLQEAFYLTQNRFGFSLDDETLANIKTQVGKCIQNQSFLSLCANKDIKKELLFKYKKQVGIIDLLLEDESEIIIIDYKTSPSSKAELYKKQMQFYKQAMQEIKNKPAKTYLYFVNEEKMLLVE